MRGGPVVKNRCIHPGCGVELSNNYSEYCREHYTQKQRESAYHDGRKRTDIPDLKCPECGRQVRWNEGFYHKSKALCSPSFLDCTGGECHWRYIAEREVEQDD